jgi:hypothetical protein
VAVERLLHGGECCIRVTRFGDVAVEDPALLIDRSPIGHRAVQLHVHLALLPTPLAEAAHPAPRWQRMSHAHMGPNLFRCIRTVLSQISIPGSNSRSSTFCQDSGKRTYISTTSQMISSDELECPDGLAGSRGRGVRLGFRFLFINQCVRSDRAVHLV